MVGETTKPMPDKFKNKYRIESNRLKYWNYSAPGSYFLTVCVFGQACILGDVVRGKMKLSRYGEILKNEFPKIPEYHPRALLDVWVIMPNHIHCIITLGDYDFHNGISTVVANTDDDVDTRVLVEKIHEFSLPERERNPEYEQQRTDAIKQYRKRRRNMIIPKIMGKFQMLTSREINLLGKTSGIKNWQPNYHDHVIRNPESYQRIKKYIINNPKNWADDTFFGEV